MFYKSVYEGYLLPGKIIMMMKEIIRNYNIVAVSKNLIYAFVYHLHCDRVFTQRSTKAPMDVKQELKFHLGKGPFLNTIGSTLNYTD